MPASRGRENLIRDETNQVQTMSEPDESTSPSGSGDHQPPVLAD